jgi:hypothetical protein
VAALVFTAAVCFPALSLCHTVSEQQGHILLLRTKAASLKNPTSLLFLSVHLWLGCVPGLCCVWQLFVVLCLNCSLCLPLYGISNCSTDRLSVQGWIVDCEFKRQQKQQRSNAAKQLGGRCVPALPHLLSSSHMRLTVVHTHRETHVSSPSLHLHTFQRAERLVASDLEVICGTGATSLLRWRLLSRRTACMACRGAKGSSGESVGTTVTTRGSPCLSMPDSLVFLSIHHVSSFSGMGECCVLDLATDGGQRFRNAPAVQRVGKESVACARRHHPPTLLASLTPPCIPR